MWDLVTRLLWLPFDLMHRISQRVLQLGRSVYGSLIAPAAKPAIKPLPPGASALSSSKFSEPCPAVVTLPERNISSSPSSSTAIPSCVTIDMESSSIPASTEFITSSISTSISESVAFTPSVDQQHAPSCTILEAAAVSELNLEHDLESPLTAAKANTELSSSSEARMFDIITSGNAVACSSSAIVVATKEQTFVAVEPEPATSKVAVANEEPEKPVQVAFAMNIEARADVDDSGDGDRGEWSTNPSYAVISIDTPPIESRSDKRFGEKEKRQQANKQNTNSTTINTEVNDVQSSSDAKKSKLSEECEQPSTSSTVCHDSTSNNKDITSQQVKKNKKRRSKKNKKGLEDQKETGEGGGHKMGVERTPPPNFFIAIQIANKEIISNVAQLQKSLTERNLSQPWHGLSTTEIFRDAMVPVAKLHFTLHVMHLKGEDDLLKAQSALTECCSEVHREFLENPMELTIEGLGHFRNNVLFAQIRERSHIDRLTKLSEIFRKKFKELNIPVDPRPFNPHMTIAKISRSNKLYKKKIRAFPSEMWSGFEQTNFGKQNVIGLQLLQMAGEDKATGYYQCFGQHYFEDPLLITTTEWQQQLKNDEDKDKLGD